MIYSSSRFKGTQDLSHTTFLSQTGFLDHWGPKWIFWVHLSHFSAPLRNFVAKVVSRAYLSHLENWHFCRGAKFGFSSTLKPKYRGFGLFLPIGRVGPKKSNFRVFRAFNIDLLSWIQRKTCFLFPNQISYSYYNFGDLPEGPSFGFSNPLKVRDLTYFCL